MMATGERNGVKVNAPDDVEIAFEAGAPVIPRRGGPIRTRRPVPLPSAAAGPSLDTVLVEALDGQGLAVAETVILQPSVDAQGRRRSGTSNAVAQVAVTLAPDQEAVLLVEQGEVYSWVLPASRSESPGRMRRGRPRPGVATFDVPLVPSFATGGTRRSFVGDLILAPVRTRVFRFAGRAAVAEGIRVQERNVVPGLVVVAGSDPEVWVAGAEIKLPRPKQGDRHRILVLVHGTFSSTRGGFGQLAPTPWGAAFLRACQDQYDAVLGYDHKTLSEDPAENAGALFEALRELNWGRNAPHIDIIAHSRGGLVVRTLVEGLIPGSAWTPTFGRAVLVGATNAGTALASPGNWNAFLDLYTNLAVAACRALSLLPDAGATASILRGLVGALGEFVRQVAAAGLDGTIAPGLAAMVPDSDFIRALNGPQPGQFSAADSIYCVVSSAFEPKLLGEDHEPREFPKRLVQVLGSTTVARLMQGVDNDLVVDTASMSAIDVAAGDFVRDRLHFGASPQIYHTNYFSRPEVVAALTRWLGLPQLDVDEGSDPPVRRRAAPARAPRGARREPAPLDVPAIVSTDIVVTSAERPGRAVLAEFVHSQPRFVVITRPHGGRDRAYAFRPKELQTALAGREALRVIDAMGLREEDESRPADLTTVVKDAAAGRLRFEAGTNRLNYPARTVVLSDSRPIGVVPNETESVLNLDIGTLARTESGETPPAVRRAAPRLPPGDVADLRRDATTPHRALRGHATGIGVREEFAREAVTPPLRPSSGAVLRTNRRSPSPPRAPSAPITCHFLAEANPRVRLGGTLGVKVTISREAVEATRKLADRAGGDVDPARFLILEAWPKRGFEQDDDAGRVDVIPPSSDTPLEVNFDLRATALGVGEIWIVARQGALPLVTLKLRPQVVAPEARVRAVPKAVAAPAVLADPAIAPAHSLTIQEVTAPGGSPRFRFELYSPALNLLKRYFSEPIKGDRQAYVEALYQAIEDRWVGSREQADEFAEELRDFGARLWRELLPSDLQRDLWTHREALTSIFVVSEEPFIPWEILFMVEPEKARTEEGRFLAEHGLVRWLYEAKAAPPGRLKIAKGRARYVIPTYPTVSNIALKPLPGAQAEIPYLQEAFAATPVEPLPKTVSELLGGPGLFDLFHFAGHGFAARNVFDEAQVMLAGETRQGQYISNFLGADRVETRADFGNGRPLVVLNACQAGRANWRLTGMGGFAKAFLARGAGLFVGTLWSVGDDTAREFTKAFYDALREGLDVATATGRAREAARTADDPSWLAYAVYGHPGARLSLEEFKAVSPRRRMAR